MLDFNEWREGQNSICIRISSNETENMSYETWNINHGMQYKSQCIRPQLDDAV